jgi:hypothetical protein
VFHGPTNHAQRHDGSAATPQLMQRPPAVGVVVGELGHSC